MVIESAHRYGRYWTTQLGQSYRTILILLLSFFSLIGFVNAQNTRTITGTVIDTNQVHIDGASVQVKGTNIATATNQLGNFSIAVPQNKTTLVISKVGYKKTEINIQNANNISVILKNFNYEIDEIIVVGYGTQKKGSVLGSITQTTGEVLQRTGGVTNLGMALTGNLPGVTTTTSSGMPGAEDPQILIRAQTSWNNSSPLILVDGIERSMSAIDISSVETVSVLKDASATAIFGVKGANGVILITTKQGKKGKADIQIRSNITTKTSSKLPEKYDSYDALSLLNQSIERELILTSGAWSGYLPQSILEKYRYPANAEEKDRYPNVDWADELFKKSTKSYNTSLNVSGGSDFVTYFASADFVSEGDLFKTFQNNRGYSSGYGYTRSNVRSNLDFNLTKTTKLSTKLFGSNGVRKLPWDSRDDDASFWASAYRTSPDAMWPIYSDGNWGFYSPKNADVPNSVYNIAMSGIENRTSNQLTTDFILSQNLGSLVKGLDFKTNLSMDYNFREIKRGINDQYNDAQRKWVDPANGNIVFQQVINPGTQLDYTDGVRWTSESGFVNIGDTYRRVNYGFQLNYARNFGNHNLTAMGVMLREKYASGSDFSTYREDWVFRTTYNYASKYFIEVNGAYNGSEKFGPDYRFAFFPSVSAGWMITNEKFMKSLPFINSLKLRGSWGKIGDDNIRGRWLYADQWTYGGNTLMGSIPASTRYTYYRMASLGNPTISWETVDKKNIALDYSLWQGKISGSVDFFRDNRYDILISGSGRAIPSYFGVAPPNANLGQVKANGLEAEIRFNHEFRNGFKIWANANVTHAKNKVIFRDNPELLPAYQKGEGYPLGQTRTHLDHGYLRTWDDIYGSTSKETNNESKLPGDFNIIDFNGDGVINGYDSAPYSYSTTPQNTFSTSFGVDWKGLSLFVQFYGVNNVTREVTFPTFHSSSHVAYVEGTYYTIQNGGEIPYPRWSTLVSGDSQGRRYQFDGSYLRLKNAEIGYLLPNAISNRMGMKKCRIYINGNNLLLWTKMPDDRESNFSGNSSFGAYPSMRRFNLGIDLTL